ncbi:MAG: phenylalanine--tRNA ligase subunit alpha [Bacteroidota bacterium]|nr:phenylalanine--tRNA ligase subunit alpha [Bacteroidota bacterium]MDP4193046.1 phenylalanine--tRNA ligase subunit alpha [Bacteroidota bacterium]
MLQTISETNKNFSNEISQVSDLKQLENLRIKYLSRKGIIATLFEDLKTVPKEDKPAVGKSLNELRNSVQTQFDTLKEKLEALSGNNKQAVDFTLPGRGKSVGSKHILIQTLDEIKTIFRGLGFSIAEGPELESDYNNFSALNFAPDHPARDMQDTFFINKDYLLRTHTSPVQIRVMQNQQPPVRAIMPGKVYRNEAISARSYCLFHQVEGLCVDKGVTFAELKGTLVSFARQFYGSGFKYRFRPSFFPFTEPSAEMDITCFLCKGKGCRMCKQTGWLEILGCGMVDPNVFKNVGYDSEKYTGYAFGMGIERIAILKYDIPDIRLYFENDLRFLKQF